MELAGRTAIVTGAGQGIGESIAKKLARHGACVVASDIDVQKALRVAEEIKEENGIAIPMKADVANKAEIHELVRNTVANCKTVHILVNNAGVVRNAPFLEMTEEEWDLVFDIDLKGVFFCIQAVLPYMFTERYGKIINISSVAATGTSGTENMANYVAAKAGVIQLTKVAARLGGPYGINVNCIAPGLVLTDALQTIGRGGSQPSNDDFEKFLASKKQLTVLERFGKPENIADLAFFLATDHSDYITGQVICIDGGRADHL